MAKNESERYMKAHTFAQKFVDLCMDAGLTARQAMSQPADCALHIMGKPTIALPSKNARRVLERYGLQSVYDLQGWTQSDLSRLKGCGNVTKSELFLLRPAGEPPTQEQIRAVLARGRAR